MLDSAFFLGLIGNIIIACAIVAIGLLTQFIRKRTMLNVENMIALSVGLILAIVFLGFLPEIISLNSIPPIIIGFWILIGVFLFYSLELFLHWHHCKDIGEQDSHEHEHENNSLIMVGTFLHNFLHGVILFSAFSLSISVGVATTIAILFHAIPQNIANLLMNHKNPVFAYIAAF